MKIRKLLDALTESVEPGDAGLRRRARDRAAGAPSGNPYADALRYGRASQRMIYILGTLSPPQEREQVSLALGSSVGESESGYLKPIASATPAERSLIKRAIKFAVYAVMRRHVLDRRVRDYFARMDDGDELYARLHGAVMSVLARRDAGKVAASPASQRDIRLMLRTVAGAPDRTYALLRALWLGNEIIGGRESADEDIDVFWRSSGLSKSQIMEINANALRQELGL